MSYYAPTYRRKERRMHSVRYHLERFPARLKKRLLPFLDLTFWVCTVLVVVPLWLLDPPMMKTLIQWSAFGLALAGLSVLVVRVMLPQVDITDLLREARQGNVAAGLAMVGMAILMSFVFLGLILWAKS